MQTNQSTTGDAAESVLVRGERVALRKWTNEEPGDWKPDTQRPYETVGYVIAGSAQPRVAGKETALQTGDAYHVPANADHSYKITEPFTAVEAISPPQ